MTVIHMDTDAVYECLNRMKRAAADLEERDQFFSQTGNALDIHWQSPAQQEYLRDLGQVRQQYDLLVDQLGQLSRDFEKEINQWVAMDQDKLSGADGGTAAGYTAVKQGTLGQPLDSQVITLIKDPIGGYYLVGFKGGQVTVIQSLLRGNRPLPTYMSRWLVGMKLDSLVNQPIQPDVINQPLKPDR